MPVITISRQYGSGGVQVARRICEVLGYSYFDKDLMAQVAGELGISEDEIVDLSGDTYRMRGFLDRLLGRRRIHAEVSEPTAEGSTLKVEVLNEAEGIKLVKDTVLAAYERGNVVIVGRGGQAILRDKPGVLHVRLVAPLGARALRVKEREDISLAEATDLVTRRDEAAAAYLQRFFDIDWDNLMLYHLVLNTGKWELSDVADIIISALTHLRMVPEI
ncbi:MAG TPA: cytidylate kinase-like family protein [Chloroflexi bacterium]|nr:cytidylate kinase-like family protein [Chloroflexota bacterium]